VDCGVWIKKEIYCAESINPLIQQIPIQTGKKKQDLSVLLLLKIYFDHLLG